MTDYQQPIVTIFSGPNGAGKSTLHELFATEQDLGIHVVSLDSPLEHQTRVAQRAARGGHYIPPEDVERRYFRAHKNLSGAIMLADVADLYTNTDRCFRVVRIANGEVTKLVQDMPWWVEQALGGLSNLQEDRIR